MPVQNLSFSHLIERLTNGDVAAFEEVLTTHGEALQREIRFTLLDRQVRRLIDEEDVGQDVAIDFLLWIRQRRYAVQTPDHLLHLLKAMARLRVAQLVRYWHAQRRDLACDSRLEEETTEIKNPERHRPDVLAQAELAEVAQRLLSDQDRQVLKWREEGMSWSDIAITTGAASGDAARKQHERSLAKIARVLKPDAPRQPIRGGSRRGRLSPGNLLKIGNSLAD